MKLLSYILLFSLAGSFVSCKKDNYSAPSIKFTGALMYNGDSISVEHDRVPFQLYQFGLGKIGPIGAYSDPNIPSSTTTFDQDGVMHALLFNGDYKFIIPNGQGPFLWKQNATGDPDTLSITVNGDQNVNIEVTPYYMIRNAQISSSANNVSATFKLEQIITDPSMAKGIEKVFLYINKTQFVSGSDNIANASMDGSGITDPNNISLTVAIPLITPTQNYVFARIGVKITGVEDLLFSSLKKLSF